MENIINGNMPKYKHSSEDWQFSVVHCPEQLET